MGERVERFADLGWVRRRRCGVEEALAATARLRGDWSVTPEVLGGSRRHQTSLYTLNFYFLKMGAL